MAGPNPPTPVSSTIHGKEDKDVKEGDSDVFNNIWTELESAGAQVYVKTSNPPPLVSKATVVSQEDKDLEGPDPPLLVSKATLVSITFNDCYCYYHSAGRPNASHSQTSRNARRRTSRNARRCFEKSVTTFSKVRM